MVTGTMDLGILEQPTETNKRVKPKHRSSQACQACRTRKVRCDVLTNGSRCTNCRLDRLECVVLASRRGRKHHTRQTRVAQSIPSRLPRPAELMAESEPDLIRSEARTAQETIISPTGSSGDAGIVPVCVTFDQDLENEVNERQTRGDDGDRQDIERAPPEAFDGLLTPGIGTEPSEPYHSPTGTASLPAFIAPLSTRILSEDVDFLTRKGTFVVPEPELQLEILRAYLFSVHPFMPVLDCRDFISAVVSNGEQGRLSLLLFQSVMFAGLHSLQPAIIHRLGFESTKQAREVFFNRARLLYDFDTEPNNAAVLQSLLLMSSWYSKWHERRHTWHWTGLAHDIARSMGLHREPTKQHASDKVVRFRKRLWWSLYIRDRMIALGTRRPPRIRDDDFDVKMLTLDDFDIQPFEEQNELISSLVQSTKERTSTALMCIQLAKLSICIGHAVSSQYTTLSTQADVPHTMMVVSKQDGDALEGLDVCNKELDEWYRTLSDNVERPDLPAADRDLHSCSEVHWTMLNLTYLTTVNVLHRVQALHPWPELAENQKAKNSSRSKVKDAARGMTRLTQTMLHSDQARFLSLIGVTAIIAACLSHMLDISSSDEDVRDASTLRLYQSIQVLQYLRGIYASADAAASFVASLTGQAGMEMPAQVTQCGAELTKPGNSNLAASSSSSSSDPRQSPHINRTWPPSQVSTHLRQSNLIKGFHTPHLGVKDGLMNPMQRIERPGATELLPTALTRFNNSTSGPRRTDTTSNPSFLDQDIFQIDTTFGGSWYLGNGSTPFDWSSNPEASMDLGLMSFNYDFYSDAFGSLEGHGKGFQQY